MPIVTRDLGSVIGPQGAKGEPGTYELTQADKVEIAEIVGTENYLPKTALNIDVYNNMSSDYPTVIDYVIGTVTVKDDTNTVIAEFETNQQRVTMYCPPYAKYTVSVTANGFEAVQSQTVVVQPNGSTISFSMTPTSEVYYDVIFKIEGETAYTERVLPHSNVTYAGETPYVSGKVWTGWDNASEAGVVTNVIANTTVNAEFITAVLPEESKKDVMDEYDYAYTDNEEYSSAYTAEELAGIIMLAEDPSDYFNIADEIRISFNVSSLTDREIILSLHSFKHYQLADGSGWAKTSWFMTHLLLANHKMDSSETNVGGWPTTGMRTWLNGTLLFGISLFIRGLMKSVKVLSSEGGQKVGIVESNDYLYLLSNAEVGLSATTTPFMEEIAEGANEKTFPMYNSNNARIKKYTLGQGSGAIYWLRSPVPSSSGSFRWVSASGTSGDNLATYSYGVAFGFSM